MKKVILSGNKPPNAAVAEYLRADWLQRRKRDSPLVITAKNNEDAVRQLMQLVGGARELRRIVGRISKQTRRMRSGPVKKWSFDELLLMETDGSNQAIRQLADRFYAEDAIKEKKAMIKRLQRLRDKSDTT